MGRITLELKNNNIDEIPEHKGIYSLFIKKNIDKESIICITVKTVDNIRSSITSYITQNEPIHQYMLSGITIILIYESLIDAGINEIFRKKKEWELIYKPKYGSKRESLNVLSEK